MHKIGGGMKRGQTCQGFYSFEILKFQGLIIQKEKVDIDDEKCAQISIVAKKTVT